MNTPVIAVITVVALIVGSTLSIKACKSGYHAWCAPIFTVRHHSKKLSRLPDCDCRPEPQDVGDGHLPSSSQLGDVGRDPSRLGLLIQINVPLTGSGSSSHEDGEGAALWSRRSVFRCDVFSFSPQQS